MEHLLIILYKKRMRDLIWLINIMRVLCRAVCFCFTIDCNFLFIACLHARTIYWLVAKKYAIRDNGKGRHEKNRRRVRLCRSETDWSASSTCYMVMATIDICLMLFNFAKYFANSWCASIHHYISLFHIFYDQFFLDAHSRLVYTNNALNVNISRRINVIIHMCVCIIIDNDFHFAQIFHILSRSTTDFCYFRWGFFSARHSKYEHACSISNIIDSETTKLTLPSSHTDFPLFLIAIVLTIYEYVTPIQRQHQRQQPAKQ